MGGALVGRALVDCVLVGSVLVDGALIHLRQALLRPPQEEGAEGTQTSRRFLRLPQEEVTEVARAPRWARARQNRVRPGSRFFQ